MTVLKVLVVDAVGSGHSVAVGSRVGVRYGDGEVTRVTITEPEHADPSRGKIAASSPLARAIIGRRVGDAVTFRVRGASVAVSIECVEQERRQ